MKRFHEAMARHSRGEKGQGMTEYIIIVALIAIAAIFIFTVYGDVIRNKMGMMTEMLGTGKKATTTQYDPSTDAAAAGKKATLGDFEKVGK